MIHTKLIDLIKEKRTLLCVGLDFDLLNSENGIPISICLDLIDKTIDWVIMYKINLAFFELWDIDIKFISNYIKERGALVIIDGKRGDIGNSSNVYQRVLDKWGVDGSTLNPYMGYDSLKPFLDDETKLSFILSLTSNDGVEDFQRLRLENGLELWEEVMSKCSDWFSGFNLGFVIGANRVKEIKIIRERGYNNFLLIPGIGYQGGELNKVLEVGLTDGYGLVLSSSRSIILSDDPGLEVRKIKEKFNGFL